MLYEYVGESDQESWLRRREEFPPKICPKEGRWEPKSYVPCS